VVALRAGRVRLTSVAFAPDGLTFATGTLDGRVRVWDVG
jgi:WD40 repeat protein